MHLSSKLRDKIGTTFHKHASQHLLPIILSRFTHISESDCLMRRGYSKPPAAPPCICPRLRNSAREEESGELREYVDTSEFDGKVSPGSFLIL